MVGEVAKLGAHNFGCAWHRLCLHSVAESDLFLHLATALFFRSQVELSSGFALAVFLVGPRAEFVVLRLIGENVVGAVELLALVEGDLFEDVVLVGLALLLFHKQVVGGGNLVVLVVLHEGGRLLEVLTLEVLLEALDLLTDDWNPVFPHDDALHLHTPNFSVPVMVTYIRNLKPFVRICLQNFLDQLLVLRRYKARNDKVAG